MGSLKGAFKTGGTASILAVIFLFIGMTDVVTDRVIMRFALGSGLAIIALHFELANFFELFTAPFLYLALRDIQHTYALAGSVILAAKGLAGVVADVAGIHELAGPELAFFLIGVAAITISVAMLKGAFSKWVGWIGILAGILSLVGTAVLIDLIDLLILLHLRLASFIVWFIGAGVRLYRL